MKQLAIRWAIDAVVLSALDIQRMMDANLSVEQQVDLIDELGAIALGLSERIKEGQ